MFLGHLIPSSRANLKWGTLGHLLQEQIPVLELLLQTLAGTQQCLGLRWAACGWEEMSPVPSSPVTPAAASHLGRNAGGCGKGPVFVHL